MNSDILQKAKKLERQIRELTRTLEYGKEFMMVDKKKEVYKITHIFSSNYTLAVKFEEIEHLLLKNMKKDEEELTRLKHELEEL